MSDVQDQVLPFREAARSRAASGAPPAWLADRRRAAWQRFEQLGFPTPRDEAWRFTSVAPITRTTFRSPNGGNPVDDRTRELVAWLRFGAPCALVFVNGRYSSELSCPWADDAVRLEPLGDLSGATHASLEARLGRVVGESPTTFASLNTALFEDGALVVVRAARVVEVPISLVFLSTSAGGAPVATHPRVVVVCERGSQATLVEAYGGPHGETYLANGVTEIVLEDGAVLDHVRVQRESEAAFHTATLAVHQGRDSRYRVIALDLGGSLARTDVEVVLDGEGGECELDGLFIVDGARHSDAHTVIDHARPHTSSRETYRGIVDDKGRGVFHGRILVRPGAQKIDAYQVNKNLVLSRTALVNSTPQLQIHADDVRCKHASTTGQIDPEALFYLRSRGIGEQAARGLLTYAFAGDIVGRVAVPAVRAAVQALLHSRLPGVPQELP